MLMLAFKMTAPIAKWKMDWEGPKGILSVLLCFMDLLEPISLHALDHLLFFKFLIIIILAYT